MNLTTRKRSFFDELQKRLYELFDKSKINTNDVQKAINNSSQKTHYNLSFQDRSYLLQSTRRALKKYKNYSDNPNNQYDNWDNRNNQYNNYNNEPQTGQFNSNEMNDSNNILNIDNINSVDIAAQKYNTKNNKDDIYYLLLMYYNNQTSGVNNDYFDQQQKEFGIRGKKIKEARAAGYSIDSHGNPIITDKNTAEKQLVKKQMTTGMIILIIVIVLAVFIIIAMIILFALGYGRSKRLRTT